MSASSQNVPVKLARPVVLLALALLVPRVEASASRTNVSELLPDAAPSPSIERTLAPPELPAFSLGLDQLAGGARVQTFHPLAAVSLLNEDDPTPDLASELELREPETRIGGSGLFLGTRIGGKPRLTLDLRWGCDRFGCELVSGNPQDPLGLAVSISQSGVIVLSDERTPQGKTHHITASWAEANPEEFYDLLTGPGGLSREAADVFVGENQLGRTGSYGRSRILARSVTRDSDEILRELEKEWVTQAAFAGVGYGAGKLVGAGIKWAAGTKVGKFLSQEVGEAFRLRGAVQPPALSRDFESFGGETLDDALRMKDQPFFNKRSRLRQNKTIGDEFRDEVAEALQREGRIVETEVEKDTLFGERYIDIEVSDAEGNLLGGIETKVGKSRYHPSQRAKDELLRRQNPPYPVIVIRKE